MEHLRIFLPPGQDVNLLQVLPRFHPRFHPVPIHTWTTFKLSWKISTENTDGLTALNQYIQEKDHVLAGAIGLVCMNV
jgi:hypothetical protein